MGYLPIEGGGLNASYTTVDAIANICATAGNLGLKYGKDFIWSHTDWDDEDDDCVVLMVKEEKYKTLMHLALQNQHRIKGRVWGQSQFSITFTVAITQAVQFLI